MEISGRRQVFALIISALACGVQVGVPAESTGSINYAVNPGFETSRLHSGDGIDSLHLRMMEPSDWWPGHASPDRVADYVWDQSAARTGTFGVTIDTSSAYVPAARYESWCSLLDGIPLAGRTVRLRADVRLEHGGSAAIEFRLQAFAGDGPSRGECGASSRQDHPGGWTSHEMWFRVPEDTTGLLVQLGITGTGVASFDNVELTVDSSGEPSPDTWTASTGDSRIVRRVPTAGVVVADYSPPDTQSAPKNWNILMYDAADFFGAYNPAETFAYAAYSTDRSNVLIFEDQYEGPATIYRVACSEYPVELVPVLELGEPDVADGATLQRFMEYADRWYPAERTLLLLYGHGHACFGACYDDTNGTEGAIVRDWLSPVELRIALEAVGGVDAVMFTAPCATSSLEAAYEVRSVVDLFVASEEMSGYWYWRDAVGAVAAEVVRDPTIEPARLGCVVIEEIRAMVQTMIDNDVAEVENLPAIAATLTARLAPLASALDAFSSALLRAMEAHRDAISVARDGSEQFLYGELVDLYDFARRCRNIPGVGESAELVMEAVRVAVAAQTINGDAHPDARGLSLFFPQIDTTVPWASLQFSFLNSGDRYRDYGLSILDATHWYDFLEVFFRGADS